jgi:hypothetical protein
MILTTYGQKCFKRNNLMKFEQVLYSVGMNAMTTICTAVVMHGIEEAQAG